MTKPAYQDKNSCLLVIDVQCDFCTGGALEVPNSEAIFSPLGVLVKNFTNVVLTQDWHPKGHQSFASCHGKEPFSSIKLDYGLQTLWPDHCVMGTRGADFHPRLDVAQAQGVFRKGFRPQIDSYSAFFDNDRKTSTGLAGYLKERGISKLYMAGLALDYCVAWSALDASRLGFKVQVDLNACAAIDLDGSAARACEDMRKQGVALVQ